MDYIIDEINRTVTIPSIKRSLITGASTQDDIILHEFDTLKKKFLENTADKYECELILEEVDVYDENDLEKRTPIGKELKAFARRKGYDMWLMELDLNDYII